jgi:membrane associated rhomboid family serine protease
MEQHVPGISKTVIVILIIHAIFFVLSAFIMEMGSTFSLYLSEAPEDNITLLYRVFSYPLVHVNPGGESLLGFLLFALFMWWVGSALEREWGSKLFILFYVMTIGISGLLCLLLLNLIAIPFPIMGTSGMTFAIIAVFAFNNPNSRFFIFGIFPLKAKWLLFISLILTFLIPSPLYIAYSLLIQVVTGLTAVIFCMFVFPLPLWLEARVQDLKQERESKSFNKKRKRFTVYKNSKFNRGVKSEKRHTDEEIRKMANREIDKILDKIKKKSNASSGNEQKNNDEE